MMFNFNVRVYGIYIAFGNILVSDELVKGERITKFPGGGLEEGEGTRECLVREWQEELDQKIETGAHFYTTDFYQKSGFGDGSQVLSIYYYVHPLEPLRVRLSREAFDFEKQEGGVQGFRLIPFKESFSAAVVQLPIDKVVADLLVEQSAE